LQKEPKLKRARQIPEWDSYDREIAAFAARISGNEGALAASVDDLAGSKKEVSDVIENASEERDAAEETHVEESVDHHGRIEDEL
jgi:UDP-glucose:glycoprotein glucosyltransferase